MVETIKKTGGVNSDAFTVSLYSGTVAMTGSSGIYTLAPSFSFTPGEPLEVLEVYASSLFWNSASGVYTPVSSQVWFNSVRYFSTIPVQASNYSWAAPRWNFGPDSAPIRLTNVFVNGGDSLNVTFRVFSPGALYVVGDEFYMSLQLVVRRANNF